MLGKNTLMKHALGHSPQDEYADNLRHVSKRIQGNVGLLLTNDSQEDVMRYFQEFHKCDFARAGHVSSQTIVLTNDMLDPFPITKVDLFRKLGLPVDVCDGKLLLLEGLTEHKLCRKGDILSVEMCKMLVQLGIELAEFRVTLLCRWNSANHSLEEWV